MTTTEYALLTLPDGAELYGSSLSALVDQIIPGHGVLPDTDEGTATRLALREQTLANLATRAQATVMASLAVEYPETVATLNEDTLTVIYHDRSEDTVELVDWASDIPLFLMASAFAPYAEPARPTGESIVFLDALNEKTFLDSMVAAGFAELYVRHGDDQ